ncbi:resuscitation-promoting factor [Nocardiopsis sp. MG754419]|uniref:resuscitation-promoting factor n=1 Tax=Nocardiopsis sp. MG754419 TaxID=2259865 RepID=UPI001BAA4A00|nr:resuscitation-promoting factor [Nocardiopsis sp. MG754419]MBR8740547.1 G5 domain-containing protein [Nocardiopsis sp. MG754419]
MPEKPGVRGRGERRAKGRRRVRSAPPVSRLVVAAVATGAITLALAGGGTALAMDQGVTIDADGEETTVRTFGGTVADVLEDAGIELDEHDAVAPSPDTPVGGGDHVIVRSPRPLTVELDGHRHEHRVNAATLDEAFGQIGLDPEGVELSEAHTTAIPADGLTVTAERAPRMIVMYDTVRSETRTTGGTVADVLDAAGVDLGEHDIVSPEPDEAAEPGMVVRVLPVLDAPETEEVVIEAETVEQDDPDLPEGEREVVTEPEDGLKEVTTATVLRHGEEVEHELSEEVVTEPVEGLVMIGTKVEEDPSTPPQGGGEAGGLNWAGLAQCESGGDPSAVNSAGGYYGLYQFSVTTWESVGGSGLPSDASPGEQTQRAQQLYNTVGGNWQSQWPHCGVHLHE